uniref:Putative nucleoporin n=1 Tax=Trypanosoma vivax (strain Y486) TaxID=1055687 RepID=G0U9W8_TRYVY|nr:putative nucleoporin [Trypanosoma vivax Y486]
MTGGFGQPAASGGFGQAASGGFGQASGATGGFGQPAAGGGFGQAGRGMTGGFGQPAASGGFGQAASGGFGQPSGTTGGFGQASGATGGFGQPAAAGGFGQAGRGTTGGFGQPSGTTGVFGQPSGTTGGFGQASGATGGFGQPTAAGGFGQAGRGTTGGFGQPAAGGGFGQAASGGFGQAGRGTTGGFGQPAASGGFGQAASGGFGQASGTTGGFGQPAAAGGGFGQAGRGTTGGFGQPAAAGGFGQAASGGFGQAGRGTTGGFGQPAAAGGFGQAASGGFGQASGTTGGFGQPAAAGGFGQAGRGTTGGFGQPAAGGGFGQAASGGFGQAGRGTTGGFGQPAAAGGFGQPSGTTSGFGQPAAGGGFGQPSGTTGGFGQPAAAGGFGQPSGTTSGFGQPAAAGGFGQPSGTTGGFGQPAAGGGFGQAGRGMTFGTTAGGYTSVGIGAGLGQLPGAGAATNMATDPSVMATALLSLPEFADKPYGNVLLFAPEEQQKPLATPAAADTSTIPVIPASVLHYQERIRLDTLGSSANAILKQQPASFSISRLSATELYELLSSSKVNLGAPADDSYEGCSGINSTFIGATDASGSDVPMHVPVCENTDYILDPPLRALQELSAQQLQNVPHFSVYRRDGKCSIHFLEPVNLVRCDISEVLELRPNGEVSLYPNADTRPSRGHGLNVRARVVVHGVIRTTSCDLSDRCRNSGLLFESYDREMGTWVYIVNADDAELGALEGGAGVREPEDDYVGIEKLSDDDGADNGAETATPQSTSGSPPQEHGFQLANARQSRAMSSVSASRLSQPADKALILPQRNHKVSLRRQVVLPLSDKATRGGTDFTLPFELPNTSEEIQNDRKGAPVIRDGYAKTHGPIYVVRKNDSRIYEMCPAVVSQGAVFSLARSFRCGWSVGGFLAAPAFAWLRDGTEGNGTAAEVHGAGVTIETPYFAHATSNHYLQGCAISVLRTLCRFIHVTAEAVADVRGCFPFVEVNLCREGGVTSLSSEKLNHLMLAVDAVQCDRRSAVGEFTARQAKTVLRLLDALYGLPDADKAESNAIVEKQYLTQLRRRNLNTWLKAELEFMDSWSGADVNLNPAQLLLHKLLCHKLRDAVSIARENGSSELARVLGICGDGNQFGSYVHVSDPKELNMDANIRQRVVSLLSGIVEPFVSQPRYQRSPGVSNGSSGDAAQVAVVPLAPTWKQLLGIFAFYGCTPDTSAEETIVAFLERLRAPSSRSETPFPPYADHIPPTTLNTSRGRDFLARGDEFPDAALSLLEGFAAGVSPVSSALHPHASSYCAMDHLVPFLILIAVRALKLERTPTYRDAETKALLGFASALECLTDLWFWALIPLHMISDARSRAFAVENCLRRNAQRFAASGSKENVDFKNVVELLRVDMRLLEVQRPPETISVEKPLNAPGLRTHASLHEAINKFSRAFLKR